MDLEFNVNNQTLKRKDSNQVVTSSSEYLRLVFDFETDDWENLDKYCFFRTGHINYPFELDEDKIVIPAYFLNDKYLLFGLLGMGDGDVRITTNVLRLHLENSYYDSETVDVRNFLEVEVDRLDGRIDGKVDIIEGKMLSTNDFTDYYRNFLDGFDGNIEAFLEDHKEEIEELLIGEALRSKADKVHKHTESDITDLKDYALVSDVPTKTSDLVNDVPFLTQHQDITGKADKTYVDTELNKKADKNTTYTKSEVNTQLNLKSDKSYVDTQLNSKADASYVDEQLQLKSDKSYVDSELDKKADITDVPTKTSDLTNDSGFITQHQDISGKADKLYVDSQLLLKSDKSYVDSELDKKADITDVPTKTSDLTNDVPFLTEHQSLEQYYLKSEVDELIHNMNNKFIIKSDKEIISTGEDTDLLAKLKEDGFPVASTMIHFFEKISPVISLSSSAQVIETGDDMDIYAKVYDEDGSLATNMKVHFFEEVIEE